MSYLVPYGKMANLKIKASVCDGIEMTKSLMIFVLWLVGFATASFAADEGVLAELAGDVKITKNDLENYVRKRIDLSGTFKNYYTVENSLNEMILTRLLVSEGMERSVPRAENFRSDEMYDDIYAWAVYKVIAEKCISIENDEAGFIFFRNNPSAFRINSSVRLYRYMIPNKHELDGRDAKAKMTEWAKSWSQGTMTLDEISLRSADIYNTEVQGDIGWVQLSNEIDIMRAVDSAKVGELVGPVEEGGFVYLFFVAAKRDARQLDWGDVKDHVNKIALEYCARENSKKIKQSLFQKYNVKINKQNIVRLFG